MSQIVLKKPIKHGDEEISVLELREPTAKEIRLYGMPIDIATGDIRTAVVHKYVCDLAALPPSVIDQLSPSDFMKVSIEIASFFGDSED